MPRPEDRDSARSQPPVIDGLAALAGDYDAFLIDAWGVLHDGVTPYPGAVECLHRLRAAARRVVVITNAARRRNLVAEQMHALGIGPELYHDLVSSGEIAWRALLQRDDPWHAALGSRCYYLGPPRSHGLVQALALSEAASIAQADFVLVTGPLRIDETDTDAYLPELEAAAARGLPMVCANPDLEAIRGGVRGISAGAIAATYAQRCGGEVRYHGKPHPAIYEHALQLAQAPRQRVLAIGDGLVTDIRGANAAGIASLLIAGGVLALDPRGHGAAARLDSLYREWDCRPDAVLDRLRW